MEVASITGHKDLRMLQRYTHLSAEKLAKKLDSNPNLFANLEQKNISVHHP
jgi:site-specific recombinase XerD